MLRSFFKRDAGAKTGVTIIAQGNKLSGEMSLAGKLHIDGQFQGTIYSTDSISVGRHGEVRGVIHAQRISVSGRIEADVHCEELNIERGGHVCGIVHSRQLSIHRKGCFVGERAMTTDSALMAPASSEALYDTDQTAPTSADCQVVELAADSAVELEDQPEVAELSPSSEQASVRADQQNSEQKTAEQGNGEPLVDMLDQMLADVPSIQKRSGN